MKLSIETLSAQVVSVTESSSSWWLTSLCLPALRRLHGSSSSPILIVSLISNCTTFARLWGGWEFKVSCSWVFKRLRFGKWTAHLGYTIEYKLLITVSRIPSSTSLSLLPPRNNPPTRYTLFMGGSRICRLINIKSGNKISFPEKHCANSESKGVVPVLLTLHTAAAHRGLSCMSFQSEPCVYYVYVRSKPQFIALPHINDFSSFAATHKSVYPLLLLAHRL